MKHLDTYKLFESTDKEDDKIHELLFTWVTSNLSNTEQRIKIGKELLELPDSILNKYREDKYLFRYQPLDTPFNDTLELSYKEPVSFTTSLTGIKTIKSWSDKIVGKPKHYIIIDKKFNKNEILIDVELFYKLNKQFGGNYFHKMIRNEKEVILKPIVITVTNDNIYEKQ